jgi:hypothetical protein
MDANREYGVPSYYKVEHYDVKDLLNSNYNKEVMLQRVQNKLVDDYIKKQEILKKRDWKNKTYELRSNSIHSKMNSL